MKTGSRIFLLFFAFSWAAFAQFPKSAWSQLPPVIQSAVTSSNVSSLAYPANVTSGKLLSVISVWETATGTPTVADTLGSTWGCESWFTESTIRDASSSWSGSARRMDVCV
jgi:hypothetical protein